MTAATIILLGVFALGCLAVMLLLQVAHRDDDDPRNPS